MQGTHRSRGGRSPRFALWALATVMNQINLSLFTWAYIGTLGKKTLNPICPLHPERLVNPRRAGDEIFVLCTFGGNHVVGLCSIPEMESEMGVARKSRANPPPEKRIPLEFKPRRSR